MAAIHARSPEARSGLAWASLAMACHGGLSNVNVTSYASTGSGTFMSWSRESRTCPSVCVCVCFCDANICDSMIHDALYQCLQQFAS